MMTAAIVVTLLCVGVLGGSTTSLIWGGVFLVAVSTRLPFLIRARWAVRVPVVLFIVSHALWFASDALRGSAAPRAAGTVLADPELLATAGSLVFCVVIVWAVYLRGRPRIETWLDAGIFVSALAPALWLLIVVPSSDLADAGWVNAWTATTIALMYVGGVFLLSGGIWNPPSVALVLGVIGNVITDIALRVPDATAPAAAPHFLIGAMAGTYVALHPDLGNVFERGGHRTGIPLDARVWMLACVVAMPVAALGWTYVQGESAPIVTISLGVGAIALIIAVRVVLLMRAGVPNWSAPLNISMTALLVSTAAVALSSLNQSAQRTLHEADRVAALLPEVRQLDGLMLRGARRRDREASTVARIAWAGTVRELADRDPELGAQLEDYRGVVTKAWAVLDRGDIEAARDLFDGPARSAQRSLSSSVEQQVRARKVEAAEAAERVRLFSVSMMALTLLAVAGLLLRFNAQRRRIDLQYQATHDELTGLPNRVALDRELARPLPDGASEHGRSLVVLALDDFKAINDAHGRLAGDAVLTAVARRLEDALRSDHMVGRLDGDAFGVLVPAGADALVAAQRMLGALVEPVGVPGADALEICGSVGLADVDEADEQRASSAFRDAELAMYQAKHSPGNSLERFSSDMDERVRGRIQLIADLRRALDGAEGLHLAYQPIVDLDSGRVAGYEALIRWTHPTRGRLSPADFIPIAEDSGLIVDLGAWVLRTATTQMAAWQREWNDDRYVSVNVAAAQFTTEALVGQVQEALYESGLAPQLLLLEVTESTLIEDIDANVAQVERIRAEGVKFALDDFGTGYSSLSYLRRFPVDVVKVDKSFIDGLDDPDGYLLVRAIVDMAISLRLRVVAEGIEEVAQARALQDFGCPLGQGFHFSRPVTPLEIQAATGRFDVPVSKRLRAL